MAWGGVDWVGCVLSHLTEGHKGGGSRLAQLGGCPACGQVRAGEESGCLGGMGWGVRAIHLSELLQGHNR